MKVGMCGVVRQFANWCGYGISDQLGLTPEMPEPLAEKGSERGVGNWDRVQGILDGNPLTNAQ